MVIQCDIRYTYSASTIFNSTSTIIYMSIIEVESLVLKLNKQLLTVELKIVEVVVVYVTLQLDVGIVEVLIS